jgi:VCBS repeat-containing protein
MIRIILISLSLLVGPLYANNINLVEEDIWGDRYYGVMIAEDDYAFIASDGVLILDISTPNFPVKVTKIQLPTFDEIIRIKKEGNHLFVMSLKEIFIVDVLNINAPKTVSTLQYSGEHDFIDFVIKDDYLYTIGQDPEHIQEYDISTISNPIQLNKKSFGNILTNALSIALIDGAIVAIADDTLYVLSTDNASKFEILYTTPQKINYQYSAIQTSGNEVYFNDDNTIIRYDFNDLDNVITSTVTLPDNPDPVYVRDMLITNNQLRVLQSSDEVTVRELNHAMTEVDHYYGVYHAGSAWNMAATGSVQLYSSRAGVTIASREVTVSDYSASSLSQSVDINNNIVGYTDETLKLLDISSGQFNLIEETDLGYSTSASFSNALLYTSDGFVYDTAAEANKLVAVGSFGSHASGTEEIIQSANTLYYLSANEIYAYDSSEPLFPIAIDGISLTDIDESEVYSFRTLAVLNGHLFIGSDGGLYHFYNDGVSLTNIGRLGDREYISSTQVIGKYLYQTYYGGLNIWDLSDINSPQLVSTVTEFEGKSFGFANIGHVDLINEQLFFQYDNKFWVLDVSEPLEPKLIETKDAPEMGYAEDVLVSESRLIAARHGQLKAYQINKAPVIDTGVLSVNEDELLLATIAVSNEIDDAISFEILTQSTLGSINVDDAGLLSYSPNKDEFGDDSFVVRVEDHLGGDSEKEIVITILPVNDSPTASDQMITVNEDQQTSGELTANDIDNETLTYAVVEQVSNGTLTLTDSGAYLYQASREYSGQDSFTFSVTDGLSTPVQASVLITISAVNDAPEVSAESLTLEEDSSVTSQLIATDIDSVELSYSLAQAAVSGVAEVSETGGITYSPNADFSGLDSIKVSVSDGELSTIVVVQLIVTAVNDAPVANTMSLNTAYGVAISGTLLGTDIDGDKLIYEVVNSVANGSLVLAYDGTFTYIPTSEYSGVDSFTYRVTDASGSTAESTVKLTIAAKPKEPDSGSSGGSVNWISLMLLMLYAWSRRSLSYRG